MSFIKNKEDFVCEQCGVLNKGNGYTNHCVSCLYSKHVDIYPGDRTNTCLGLMKPVYISYTNKDSYVIHECLKCFFQKKNLLSEDDSVETMIQIQKSLSDNI